MSSGDQERRGLRDALGRFATGVTVVTATGPDNLRVGVTANSFSSVSLSPPLILWSLERNSPSLSIFQAVSHFCVNVLRAEQEDLCRRFATPRPNKFNNIAHDDALGGASRLAGCLAWFECRNRIQHDGGDHVIFIGEVERFEGAEGSPLLFYGGQLLRLEA